MTSSVTVVLENLFKKKVGVRKNWRNFLLVLGTVERRKKWVVVVLVGGGGSRWIILVVVMEKIVGGGGPEAHA